jgi:hypothetical protein
VSELWKQLGHLYTVTKDEKQNEKQHSLFYVNNSGYLIPELDVKWPRDSKVCEKMKAFYIAVGRLMGACVAKGIPIAAHVLVSFSILASRLCEFKAPMTHHFSYKPDFYKNFLLRNLSPEMNEYPIHDLVIHAFELASPGRMESAALSSYKSFMDWILMIQGEAYNEENLEQDFRNYMQAEYVASKSDALLYLKQGITLNCK